MGHNNSIWRITTYSHVVRNNIENGKKESQYISIIVFVRDWILNWISAIDWVRGQQQFCLTRGRICCPKPQGQTKLLLSEKPVYNCFVVHLHFFPNFFFTVSTRIFIRCFQYSSPWSPRIPMPLYIVTSISRDEFYQWKKVTGILLST